MKTIGMLAKCMFIVLIACVVVLHFSGQWSFSLPCNVIAITKGVGSFFWNNLDLYGIVACVLALFSLVYTFLAYVSQCQTENNTRNVPVKDQVAKFRDLTRHEYRNLVVVVATAVKFFAEANMSGGARRSYPSESHILKLQAAPEDFVLDINPEMAATVSEMRLLLRNYNIEITVACSHLAKRSINEDVIEQDYDNLIFKPLFLIRKACNMEAKLSEEEEDGFWNSLWRNSRKFAHGGNAEKGDAERGRVRRLLLRSMEIITCEHLNKLPTSLPNVLKELEKQKNDTVVLERYMQYFKAVSADNGLAMSGVDNTEAMLRSFGFLYGDMVEKDGDGSVTIPWTWGSGSKDTQKICNASDDIIGRLDGLKGASPEAVGWLDAYKAELVRIREGKQVDFMRFFPLMLRMDVVAELKNIGMVDFEQS